MASKSKKRRRVFRASCILAALIIAGSSFAWFTSSDEVTNRLTASSDYGVSIVESYEPPKNWVPGQTVNKDVYAVNTGNVAAFVKEDITGRLSYTYEKPVAYDKTAAAATAKEKGVELNDNQKKLIDGSTTMEAGSILAWTDTDEPTGVKSVARQQEDPAVVSRWTPTKTGVYVFRRSVDTTDADNTKFTYAGYYYDADVDKYYEIRIGNDVDPEHKGSNDEWQVSSGSLGPNVRVDEEGIVITKNADNTTTDPLTGAAYATPTIQLVTVEESGPNDVEFTFDRENHRLVVTKATTPANTSTDTNSNAYDASATAARAEIDYLNAKGESDDAETAYNQTLFDFNYATALANARNTLVSAATTRRTAYNSYATATSNKDTAEDAVQAAAASLKGTYVSANNAVANKTTPPAIAPATIVPAGVVSKLEASDASTKYPKSYQNYADLKTLWNNMYGTTGYASKIAAALTYLEADHSAAEMAAKVQELIGYITDLEQALSDYKEMYANLIVNADKETGMDTGDASTNKTAIGNAVTSAGTFKSAVTGDNGLKAKSDDYTTKTATEATQSTANDDAEEVWKAAVNAYNVAVTRAQNTYKANIAETSPNGVAYQDNSATLVPCGGTFDNTKGGWSAQSTGNNPQITYAAELYNTYEEVSDTNAGTIGTIVSADLPKDTTFVGGGNTGLASDLNCGTDSLSTLKSTMNTKVGTTDTAKAAYDVAVQKLVDGSEIVIYVNLDEHYADNWTFDYDNFMSTANGQKTAEFYYNKILGAGETSTRLIDNVKLADTVTANAYKDFVFDLNVGLDSIQVSYDNNDQNKISTTAVNADPAFKLDATMTDAKDITSDVIWAKSST